MIPISINVVRTLRYMLDSDLSVTALRGVDQRTLAPAIRRGLVKRNGGRVYLTPSGVDLARNYGGRGLMKRKYERDVSSSVASLLGMVRLVKERSKKAAA